MNKESVELFLRKTKRPLAIFVAFSLLVAFVTAGVSQHFNGSKALLATAVALLVCGGGGALSIISINFLRYALKKDLACIMMGILFRSGVPMLVVLGIFAFAEKEFGTFVMIHFLILYLCMLPLEVYLTLPEKENSECDL